MKRVQQRPTVTLPMAQKAKIGYCLHFAQALTVTASARVKAREDSRTDSMKRPEGGNGGVGRAIRKYSTRLGDPGDMRN